jgi:hypothetical protein
LIIHVFLINISTMIYISLDVCVAGTANPSGTPEFTQGF